MASGIIGRMPQPLDSRSFSHALEALSTRDADLAKVLERYGPPPMWARPGGFPSLVRIILEQQVSLASARAAFERLEAASNPLTPARFLQFDDAQLKRIGFSRQKASYVRGLAQSLLDGSLDLDGLEALEDEAVHKVLTSLKGIGPWTANIYLLMALLRPDVWPSGDLALVSAMQQVKGLSTRPTVEVMEQLSQPWQPWRAVAARILWHHYLSQPSGKLASEGLP